MHVCFKTSYMKRMLLSFLFVAAFGTIASAQNGKNTHGKTVSATAHKSTTTTTTTSASTSVNGTGTTASTAKKHTGWTKGKHKGWTKKSKTTVTTKM